MLKQRVATAAVLAPLAVWGILALSTSQLAIVLSAFILIGAWEWTGLSGVHQPLLRGAYLVTMAGLLGLSWEYMRHTAFIEGTLYASLVWWLLAFVWILQYPFGAEPSLVFKVIKLVAGVFVLIPAWTALLVLHGSEDYGPLWVLFVLGLIWIADTGAYFAGKRWGRKKLAPRVSPNKTNAGVYGALALVLVYGISAGFFLLDLRDIRLSYFVVLALCLVPVSVLGDLYESMLKRHCGCKDSGSVLPGHGGILDRIDSLTATAPLFVLGLLWLKIPT